MINCLVVDDEPIARHGLLEHIKQIDFLFPVAECKSAIEATGWIEKKAIDLIFLDIQMPKLTGIDFIKSSNSLPAIILTTAYPEFAIEGYELDVVDYLLKPISFRRFMKAALKAKEFIGKRTPGDISFSEDYFFIKCNQRIEKIMMTDVLYIEAMSNYITIHTIQKKYLVYMTFKGMEEQLPKNNFIRIHKSFLVSVNAISSIDTHEIKLGKVTLPISKNYKEEVLNRIDRQWLKR